MRVAFVTLRATEPLAYGLMSLTAVLRQAGHEVAFVYGRKADELRSDPEVQRADVLAFSSTTGLHRVYVSWVRALRRWYPDKCIIMGGSHPTFFPQVIETAPLDGVCIGEGEESFPEFLEAHELGASAPPDGWWIRRDRGSGEVVEGSPRGPVQQLSGLPTPAYDVFYDDPHYRKLPIRVFMASRGCPYRCRYCFNRTLNEHNRPFGPLVRTRDPERVIEDIQRVRRRWGVRLVWFVDANFVANRKWLEAFVPLYAREVGLPFFCKLRPERASEPVVSLLRQAGCVSVGVGIESGSERVRREVLGRPVSDADILAGCARLKQNGFRILAFNMLGIPGESLDEAFRSVALNAACKVDLAAATILQPYPGTELARWAIEQGHFDGNFDRLGYSYFAASPFRYPTDRDRDRITNLQRLFSLAVEFPEVRSRLRRLIDRPPSRLFRFAFTARHGWGMRHTIYRGFDRQPPQEAGRAEVLDQVKRELGVGG